MSEIPPPTNVPSASGPSAPDSAEPDAGTPEPVRVTCPYCVEDVPVAAFCGACGAHLVDHRGRTRADHFAADPSEHVAKMAVISTLFPLLPRRHAHLFRETFVAGVLAVLLLSALRLYTPALVFAAAILPALYLIYLYEVEVYEDRPFLVLVATFGLGSLLGVGFSLGFAHVYVGGVLFNGVGLPVIAQLCMLAGPVLLVGLKKFEESLDGLTFGVMSALGFTLASVVAEYWHTLTTPLVGAAAISTDQAMSILRAAIIAGVVNSSTTGILTARIWLSRHRRSRHRHHHAALSLPAAIVVGFGFQVGLGVATYWLPRLLLTVIVWAFGAGILLVWLRVTIHHALLEEGEPFVIGRPNPCPECDHLVPTMPFCPFCGVARSAEPKHARTTSGVAS